LVGHSPALPLCLLTSQVKRRNGSNADRVADSPSLKPKKRHVTTVSSCFSLHSVTCFIRCPRLHLLCLAKTANVVIFVRFTADPITPLITFNNRPLTVPICYGCNELDQSYCCLIPIGIINMGTRFFRLADCQERSQYHLLRPFRHCNRPKANPLTSAWL
jgi:hypothetical protein